MQVITRPAGVDYFVISFLQPTTM